MGAGKTALKPHITLKKFACSEANLSICLQRILIKKFGMKNRSMAGALDLW